jgi:zinc transport system substrate-binding protein
MEELMSKVEKIIKGYLSRAIILSIIIALSAIISSCTESSATPDSNNKIKIVTTLFPNYDFAKQITKDKAEVTLLLPPGVEAHSFDPSPKDIVKTRDASVFIYTSTAMEPWADKIIQNLNKDQQVILESSKGIKLSKHEDEEIEHDEETPDHEVDPHIWVNPAYAQVMVKNITTSIIEADPENADFYKKNSEELISKLSQLDTRIKDVISKVDQKIIIYGGHFVFGYFTERYGLDYITPYKGFSPESEPTPQKLTELINKMKELKVKVIYFEELVDPKVSRVIAEQTGAKMLLLHGAHNVSQEELDSGITYIKIMDNNLNNLKQGLIYNE